MTAASIEDVRLGGAEAIRLAAAYLDGRDLMREPDPDPMTGRMAAMFVATLTVQLATATGAEDRLGVARGALSSLQAEYLLAAGDAAADDDDLPA